MSDPIVTALLASEEYALLDWYLLSPKGDGSTVPTCAVDSRGRLYVNPKFISSLSTPEVVGIMAHEALHLDCGHFTAQAKKDMPKHEIANIAMDAVINKRILAAGLTLPSGAVTYTNLGCPDTLVTSKQIYDWLIENKVEDPPPGFDEHIICSDEPDEALPEQMAQALKAVKTSIEVKTQLVELAAKKVDVSDVVKAVEEVTAVCTGLLHPVLQRTYTRPARYQPSGCILPAQRVMRPKPKVAVLLDRSDSMAGSRLTKAVQVAQALSPFIRVINAKTWTFNTKFERVELTDLANVSSGGGTAIEGLPEDCGKVDALLILTDCEFPLDFCNQLASTTPVIFVSLGGALPAVVGKMRVLTIEE